MSAANIPRVNDLNVALVFVSISFTTVPCVDAVTSNAPSMLMEIPANYHARAIGIAHDCQRREMERDRTGGAHSKRDDQSIKCRSLRKKQPSTPKRGEEKKKKKKRREGERERGREGEREGERSFGSQQWSH